MALPSKTDLQKLDWSYLGAPFVVSAVSAAQPVFIPILMVI